MHLLVIPHLLITFYFFVRLLIIFRFLDTQNSITLEVNVEVPLLPICKAFLQTEIVLH